MKPLQRERGQSLVELAISLVILLYLLAGAAEFGVLFFQYIQLRDAAQEGALYGSTNPSALHFIEDRVRGASGGSSVNPSASIPINLWDQSKVTVRIYVDNVLVYRNYAVQGANTNDCEGHALRVEAAFPHQIFTPFMSRFIGTTYTLTASVTDTILAPYTCS